MIEGIVFDFDGVILDTEMSAYQTWLEIYQEYGIDLPFSTWAICIGGSPQLFDPALYLEEQLGQPVPREELRRRRRERHVEVMATQLAMPGIEEYLREGKLLGLKMGVASSSTHEWVGSHLTRLGLLDYFDTMKCREDVAQTKPDPALYLAVLDALGLQSDQAIAIEDSPNGVTAAQRAGIFCVAVPNPVTAQLPLEHADFHMASLTDMPLQRLLAVVQERQKAASRKE
ncbi:MAG TPA: HAD family hydrolase [Ktedonobacteraceae bacterium]|nr:HAD family hydrolase [Ktedonobacteraceae bacterium]